MFIVDSSVSWWAEARDDNLAGKSESWGYRVVVQADRCELAILRPAGEKLEITCSTGMRVTSDAKAAYLDRVGGSADRILVRQATFLELGDQQVFRDPERRDWEIEN